MKELALLLGTAVTIGFVHTVLGPDHYLPFIVMAKSGRWSAAKTAVVTALCGVGHIASSVALGLIGIALGPVKGAVGPGVPLALAGLATGPGLALVTGKILGFGLVNAAA